MFKSARESFANKVVALTTAGAVMSMFGCSGKPSIEGQVPDGTTICTSDRLHANLSYRLVEQAYAQGTATEADLGIARTVQETQQGLCRTFFAAAAAIVSQEVVGSSKTELEVEHSANGQRDYRVSYWRLGSSERGSVRIGTDEQGHPDASEVTEVTLGYYPDNEDASTFSVLGIDSIGQMYVMQNGITPDSNPTTELLAQKYQKQAYDIANEFVGAFSD